MKKRINYIIQFAKPHKWKFFGLFLCIVVTTFTGAFYPYIFGVLVDEVFYGKNMEKFLNIMLIYGVVYSFNQAMHFALNMFWANLMTRFLFDIRKAIFSKVLSYKGSSLSNLYSGDIVVRMGTDVEQFMSFIHWNFFYTIGGILNLVISIGFIFYISPPLAILTIILTPISVYISHKYAGKIKGYYQKISEKEGIIAAWIFEIIKGIQDIKLLRASKKILGDYAGKSVKISRLKIEAGKVEVISERVSAGVSLFGELSLYILSAILIVNGHLTVGGFTACVTYFSKCVSVFSSLNNKSSAIAGNLVSIDRVIKVLEEEYEAYNTDMPLLEIEEGAVRFENVTFSYYDHVKVLDNISFDIYSGEKVALVGHSGAGKSTIANLIVKFLEVQNGKILIDGTDIKKINLIGLRNQIGIVNQSPAFFEGTIRYNLIFTNDDSRDQEIWEALKSANISSYVYNLPEGLDTIMNEGRVGFSGGQKQRLAIARIFIKNPKIILFDEATSALDFESERVIKDSWEQLCKGRTTIIIAHRLSTILDADRILVLQGGGIVGNDNHENLLKSCDPYIQLFQEQSSLKKEGTVYV